MEAQILLCQVFAGFAVRLGSIQLSDLAILSQVFSQSLHVEGPRVDVRVNLEVACRTIEEGFALFPVVAGLLVAVADGVDFALRNGSSVL